jgi:(S)-sulfolactate dehydrogenase
MGVVGFGTIGQLVAQLALGLGMKVVAHARREPSRRAPGLQQVPLLPLHELLRCSDVVSLHVPLTADTRHLIGADQLALMSPRAVLINTARGGVVDLPALLAALREHRLRGAALDVYDTEPLPAGSILAERPARLLLSAHVASATVQSEHRVGHLVVDKLLASLERAAASSSAHTPLQPSTVSP